MAEQKKNKKRNPVGSLISFLLFIIAAGALFYFGWVQFELPENTYAVLFSKTGGYDSQILEPAKFNWKWERILPTNSKLIKFHIENRSIILEYKGELPSSELYSSITPQNPDFSYNITFSINYRLDENSLPRLLSDGLIDNNNLEGFYSTIESEFIQIMKNRSTDFFIQNLTIDSNAYSDLESIIREKLKDRYQFINIGNLTIQYISFPDLQLYDKTREIYFQILDKRKETEIASEQWAIESKINLDTKLEILTKYGELLTKYPILVDYFALDPGSQVLDISNLKEKNFSISDE